MKTDIYSIIFHPEISSVEMEWAGYATSAQFREGTEILLAKLAELHATKILANLKKMVLIGHEDQEWMATHFLPRALAIGVKASAVVQPESYFNKIAVETISYKLAEGNILIRFFTSPEEARLWLRDI